MNKSYLRDNVFDAFAQDDWRVLPSLTLIYGLRYEFFAPYTEKYGHLGEVSDESRGEGSRARRRCRRAQSGLPDSLVYPFRTAFAPRLGLPGACRSEADCGARAALG